MALVDIIDSWSTSFSRGSFEYDNGYNLGYSFTADAPYSGGYGFDNVALIRGHSSYDDGAEIVFDTPVENVTFGLNGFHGDEKIQLVVDGNVVDLNTLLGNGDVSITGDITGSAALNVNGEVQFSSAGGPEDDVYITFNIPIERAVIRDVGGSISGVNLDMFLDPAPEFAPPCFTTGTLIDTDRGQVAVEDLTVGDRVRTMDHGFQPIRWVGHSRVMDAPIRIKAGTFDNTRDMVVSPRHRMLLQGWQVGLLFNHDEAFATASDMKNGDTISVEPEGWVDYYHILLPHHEVIFAEGAATESFYPDAASVNAMAKQAREDLHQHFNSETYGPTARPTLTANQAMYVGHNLDVLGDEPAQAQIQAAE